MMSYNQAWLARAEATVRRLQRQRCTTAKSRSDDRHALAVEPWVRPEEGRRTIANYVVDGHLE
jgi:hypothetical protein